VFFDGSGTSCANTCALSPSKQCREATRRRHANQMCNHKRMFLRRSVQLVALACLLLNALDCYGASFTSAEARKCCGSGHCSPTNRDSCCKNAPAGTSQVLEFHPKASVQNPVVHVAAVIPMPVDVYASPRFQRIPLASDDHPPPRDLPGSSLPLRI
jgi:hypothetical protein